MSLAAPQTHQPPPPEPRWARLIPDDQWGVFRAGCEAAQQARVRYLLGGALALATYIGRWRNTKDIDFFVHACDWKRLVAALKAAGFSDYFEREAYDRSWIFRSYRDDVILDVIWTLPNHRIDVDAVWFERARRIRLRGGVYETLPVEELIRIKLYVLQRERCDWVDIVNIMASSTDSIDWDHLLARMGPDRPLLHAALAIFNWMSPRRAGALPAHVREEFALPLMVTADADQVEVRRARLFDSRPWFAPHQPQDRPLER